jgi:hypothetical protein
MYEISPPKSRDVKDIHVHVHIRNIPYIRGYFRNVKVPSSRYKRGCGGTCKGTHNFGGVSSLLEIICLFFRELCSRLERSCILSSCTSVFGDPFLASTVFHSKNNSWCHHRRGRRRTPPLRPIKKTTIKTKTTESLTFVNLQTSQTKNEEQNLRPSKRQELEKQYTS